MELPTPTKIEAAAAAVGLSMSEVCRRSGVSRRAWERWKHGKTTLRLRSLEAMVAVVEQREGAAIAR